MEQNFYFNETCDPVDLSHCSEYYVDPCDCTQFYQCDQNQRRMFHLPCANGTIYSHKTWVCDYPNDAICQTLRPWERCNVTESRMEQLRSMCFKSIPNSNNTGNSTPNSNSTGNSTPNSNNTGNSDQNTNGISVPLITQTILPTVFGVLLPVIIIGLVIHRYRNRRISIISDGSLEATERISTISDGSLGAAERINTISDGSLEATERISSISDGSLGATERISTISDESLEATERFTRNHESHLSDPYNSLEAVTSSIPEYGLYPTQRENPLYGVHIDQSSVSDSSPTIDNSCISVSQSDPIVNLLTMPQPRDVQIAITQEGETVTSEDSSYPTVEEPDSTPSPSTMPGASDDDCDCSARRVHSENRPEGDIVSNEDSFISITGEYDQTHNPLAIPRPCEAERPFPERNSQEDETSSDDDSSYEYVLLESYTTAMPQPSDADREFADVTISSEDSAYVDVQGSDPLYPPYYRGNGPWPHKVIFPAKEHFLPRQAERT